MVRHMTVAAWITAAALPLIGCGGGDQPQRSQPAIDSKAPVHAVKLRERPAGRGSGLPTGLKDHHGQPIKAPCRSCHAGKAPTHSRRTGKSLAAFHTGLTLKHGGQTCLTCHNPDNYDTLRLADGTAVAFDDSMALCGQCHGPQKRDYDHGSHGGMTGYWDRTRGPQVRNQCVHCHDPHAPTYVGMVPGPRPRDRFLRRAEHPTDHGKDANHSQGGH